jgi:hypothetical protein
MRILCTTRHHVVGGGAVFLLVIDPPTVMAVIAALSPSTHTVAGRPNLGRSGFAYGVELPNLRRSTRLSRDAR